MSISPTQNRPVSFLDERVVAYLCQACQTKTGLLPQVLVRLIAEYAIRRFDPIIFGPEHWKLYWDATPVTLPSIEELRSRMVEQIGRTGIDAPQSFENMSAEEYANFLGELGQEEHPEPPEKLHTLLDTPVRQGEIPAGFTCAVTYIPEYIRKDGKVFAVTARTLALELGPKPKQGHPAQLTDPNSILGEVISPENAQAAEPSCYFVMEIDGVPNQEGQTIYDSITKVSQHGWELPRARNFLATVFARRVWKGEQLFAKTPRAFTCGTGRDLLGYYLTYGGYSKKGFYATTRYVYGDDSYTAGGSRKIPLSTIS